MKYFLSTGVGGTELANTFRNCFVILDNTPLSVKARQQIKKTRNSIFRIPVDDNGVSVVILSFSNISACDAGGISWRPFKYVVDILALDLPHIFNGLLSKAVFAKQMHEGACFI